MQSPWKWHHSQGLTSDFRGICITGYTLKEHTHVNPPLISRVVRISVSVSVNLLSFWILNLLLKPLKNSALKLFNVTFFLSFFFLLAWLLQASHLLQNNAKTPGSENSQGWALSVQSGVSARGATEKVLDHKLDRDAALLLLRPLF